MAGLKASELKPYSFGIVAANKALNSFQVEVTPVEHLPMLNGQITDQVTQMTASGTDASGAAYNAQANQSSTITATWLPIGESNRMTPPDVRRGEQVMLYQFADSDTDYYWATLRNDLTARKLETMVMGISGTPNEGDPADPTTSYVFGMSSHQKQIWITTSQKNGEKFGYTIMIDGGAGTVKISDNINNYFLMDSVNHILHLENADGSYLELNKEIFNLFTGQQINMKSQDMTIQLGGNMTTTVGGAQSTTVTGAQSLKAQTTSLTSTTNTMTTTTNHIGDLTVAGDFNTIDGPNGQQGEITSNANFTTTKDVSAANVNASATVTAQTVDAQNYENLPG